VLRGLMIAGGVALVSDYGWILYVFAAFLIFTGIKMLFAEEKPMDVQSNPAVKFLSKHIPVTAELHGEKFLVRVAKDGKMALAATPLLLALIVINLADLVFAVDSVPAILAITTDTFIVYTSNIMAILGLRALYFALAAMVHRFHYLKYALALVLVFIGSKIFIADFVLDGGKFPPAISLGVTFGLIAGGVIWSLVKTRGEDAQPVQDDSAPKV
jgi:tellurite resistance protein TerC